MNDITRVNGPEWCEDFSTFSLGSNLNMTLRKKSRSWLAMINVLGKNSFERNQLFQENIEKFKNYAEWIQKNKWMIHLSIRTMLNYDQ